MSLVCNGQALVRLHQAEHALLLQQTEFSGSVAQCPFSALAGRHDRFYMPDTTHSQHPTSYNEDRKWSLRKPPDMVLLRLQHSISSICRKKGRDTVGHHPSTLHGDYYYVGFWGFLRLQRRHIRSRIFGF